MELTQEYLKSILHYDPETGVFTWRESRFRIAAGSVAGHMGSGYRKITFYGQVYMAHRLAFLYMTGAYPSKFIDHINGDSADNRWANLRDVSQQENMRNQHVRITNHYGVTGVYRYKGRWRAYIFAEKQQKHLGLFEDFFEAVCARKSAEGRFGFHPNHGRKINFLKRL